MPDDEVGAILDEWGDRLKRELNEAAPSAAPAPAALTAELDRIEKRESATHPAHGFKEIDASQADVAPLLKAVRAVLKEHRKMLIYETSVLAHDHGNPPEVHCGHTLAETENSRHVLDDGDNIICLDKHVGDVCESCYDESGEMLDWPCPTVRAITSALTGKGGPDGG